MAVTPNTSELDIIDEMSEQFRIAKLHLDPMHKRMNQQEELYRTFIDKNSYPHNARVFDPRIFRVIETITPRIVANEPTGHFYPAENGDNAAAQILNALMKYDWYRAEMFPKLVLFVKSMLIFGTAFGRTYWDFRECDRTRMKPKKLNGRLVWTPMSTEKIKYTEFDSPNFETLNIYDCFPDPNASTLQNMRWFIYRTFTTIKELEDENDARGGEFWKNLDVLKTAIAEKKDKSKGRTPTGQPLTGGSSGDIQFREFRRRMLATQEFVGKDASSPEFVVLRRMTREGWTFIVPEYQVVIREVENPYFHGDLPIIYGVDYPYPGELYGMGEIEPIDRIQRAINAVLNQRLDNVQLTLRTMWKVKKNSGVDMNTLVSAPGNIITTDDMNAVERVDIPDVTGQTFVNTMNYLTSALQNGSGITDYTIGINQQSNVTNKTFGGAQLIQSEANAQFKLKIQLFNHMVIQRIVNQWKDLRIQYTTEAQKLRILGKEQVASLRDDTNLSQTTMDGEPIAPGETDKQAKLEVSGDGNFAFLNLLPDDIQPSIVGDYDFIATVAIDQLTDPLTMQQNFFGALDRVMSPEWSQMLFRHGKMLNVLSLTEKVFEKMQVGVDGKDILTDFPKGQNFNFDMPKVDIKFEDLPAKGKVQAASNAGIELDPNDPALQQMGRVDTRITVDAPTQGQQVLETEGLIRQTPPPETPMSPQDMQSALGQQIQQHQTIQQAVTQPPQQPGVLPGDNPYGQ